MLKTEWDCYIVFISNNCWNNLYFAIANPLFITSRLTVLSECTKTTGTKCDTLILNTNNSKREANSIMALSFLIFRILVFIILIYTIPSGIQFYLKIFFFLSLLKMHTYICETAKLTHVGAVQSLWCSVSKIHIVGR